MLLAPAGGQLGGQAHDYQALKADLATHGRQFDNPAYEATKTASVSSSQTSTASFETSVSEKSSSTETTPASEQKQPETTTTEIAETAANQIAGSAAVTRDATSVKPSAATVSVESLPEPTKTSNQGGRLKQEVKVVLHKVSSALATN